MRCDGGADPAAQPAAQPAPRALHCPAPPADTCCKGVPFSYAKSGSTYEQADNALLIFNYNSVGGARGRGVAVGPTGAPCAPVMGLHRVPLLTLAGPGAAPRGSCSRLHPHPCWPAVGRGGDGG